MKFSGKKEFKEAIIKYCLANRKVIRFIKDEPTRVRAKCDWQHCPWVCLCSKNSRTDSWQIATFIDQHTCPPRMDNKRRSTGTVQDIFMPIGKKSSVTKNGRKNSGHVPRLPALCFSTMQEPG